MKNPSAQHFDAVKIKLNGLNKLFIIEALVMPAICCRITNHKATLVAQKYPYLRNLKLTDSFDDELMNINILIGTYFYQTSFTD